MFSSYMIAIKKYIYFTGLMAAILDFTRKKAFLKEDSGGILCCFK